MIGICCWRRAARIEIPGKAGSLGLGDRSLSSRWLRGSDYPQPVLPSTISCLGASAAIHSLAQLSQEVSDDDLDDPTGDRPPDAGRGCGARMGHVAVHPPPEAEPRGSGQGRIADRSALTPVSSRPQFSLRCATNAHQHRARSAVTKCQKTEGRANPGRPGFAQSNLATRSAALRCVYRANILSSRWPEMAPTSIMFNLFSNSRDIASWRRS